MEPFLKLAPAFFAKRAAHGKRKETRPLPKPKKIMVIDDEPDVLEFVKDDLEAEGYEVRTAEDGVSGLEITQEFKPDLIFLDMRMPRMDGFQFLEKLCLSQEEDILNTPVIMISAYGETNNIFKAQASRRVRDFVIKPFLTSDLIKLIRRYA